MLDVFLALKGDGNRFMRLKIDQRFDAVTLGKTVCQTFPVLVNAPNKIACYTDIQCSPGLTGENVYPIGHLVRWIAGSSPAMTEDHTRIGIST